MYNVGEMVVNRDSYKQGQVSEINESEQKVQIRYEDGSSQWVDVSNVSKLLLEVDPKTNPDGWGRENNFLYEDDMMD
tara:strand:+ start:170 stop:400 length:231 start_codon:yes stop_codon:yes gene_type:complete